MSLLLELLRLVPALVVRLWTLLGYITLENYHRKRQEGRVVNARSWRGPPISHIRRLNGTPSTDHTLATMHIRLPYAHADDAGAPVRRISPYN